MGRAMEDILAGLLGGGTPCGMAVWWCWQQIKALREASIKRIEDLDLELQAEKALREAHVVAFADYKVHVAETYAGKSMVEKLGDRIEAHLTRIEDKLDKKADKP